MKLVAIDPAGVPEEPVGTLSADAEEACRLSRLLYGSFEYTPPWTGYLTLADGEVVGVGVFKGPVREGRVEIAYSTFPPYRGRGHGRRIVAALVALAAEAHPGVVVTAQTPPQEDASTAILRRLGFRLSHTLVRPPLGLVWEWEFATRPPAAG